MEVPGGGALPGGVCGWPGTESGKDADPSLTSCHGLQPPLQVGGEERGMFETK